MRAALILLLLLAAAPAGAQDITLSLGGGDSLAGRTMLTIALLTVLSLAPGLAIMVTCFPFIVTVLSILRQAIGLQQSPPNMLIVSLAMFLTWFIMEPVFTEAWTVAAAPLIDGIIDIPTAFDLGSEPFRGFMARRIDPDTFTALLGLRPEPVYDGSIEQAPLSVLVPSFMLSEVSRAFEIGFLLYLPFLIIDLVVSAVLMSMGMMMVPPAVVALPFKLAFFVVADGWTLVSGALVRSYF
ncbi:flagellar type III secretion system pore protein FliP [Phaeovulum sp.]|jgi:flagellar biosynthetic protein FliP|uniref:flagellar type III secretion system pore protein FliP n=1 Tax=Phaeovulum sp. TaxID=2934796 RepID=UPI0027316273|nr:flagellar type III secretion system pore protein FliP [Phaeovulum sp.]MDP1669218.1 flagellar type III secretion system pore protein FliP [Phaeovulum sp.]MDP2062236.1 flagellar type III secretion system pore protein FliP [Phaeovulum sp.]MDP3863070.1 flagellar type III secretion system pore protein FliP [Phaeovulum sp.]MDZ4120508.1 flagellar type III secretion system pore protein FliP [Phaeovulum sp.]